MKNETEKTPEVRIQELEKQVDCLNRIVIIQGITLGTIVIAQFLLLF